MQIGTRSWIVAAALVGAAAAVLPRIHFWPASSTAPEMTIAEPAVGMPGAPATSADGLRRRVDDMEARLRQRPDDAGAAVLLADALLRQARATTDGRPANRAADVLSAVLKEHPAQYDALRMLGAIHLSRHRFRDALAVARRGRDMRPGDAWNYGVMGDALLELGEYDEAFAAFDRMAALRPTADAYARVSYARELTGDLDGALAAMRLAESATSAHDLEAKAWYAAHVAELDFRAGRIDAAERGYRYAAYLFPQYPYAMTGLGKVKQARGDMNVALDIYLDQMTRTPSLDLAARIGDLYRKRGDWTAAEHYYDLAEQLAGPALAQTEANLALFMAERDRKLPEALAIAQRVSAERSDIFTNDALAWTLYKSGRVREAAEASRRSLRTGTRDERILAHAAAIRGGARTPNAVPAPAAP
jgi:tetratricopeptide (TPR) repeat protein